MIKREKQYLAKNTERPVTVREGTNIVVGSTPHRIVREATRIINRKEKKEEFLLSGKIKSLREL